MTDDDLIRDFVASFETLDDLFTSEELDPVAWELLTGESDELGYKRWRPVCHQTEPAALSDLYSQLPYRFPRLYEQLVLSYRWAEVDLRAFRLLPNPPGPNLSGLLAAIRADKGLWDALVPAGYLQFGKGPGLNYDPVCFDLRHRRKGGECPIVRIDHEEILCNYRVKVVEQIAPTFRDLVLRTVATAKTAT